MRSNLYIKYKLNFKNWPGNFLKYRSSRLFLSIGSTYSLSVIVAGYRKYKIAILLQNYSKKLKIDGIESEKWKEHLSITMK